MPLEQLERLFERVGQTAQQLAQVRSQDLAWGGRVARSEAVGSVADLYAQLGRGPTGTAPMTKAIEKLTEQIDRLRQTLEAQERKLSSEPSSGFLRRLMPHRMLEPLLRFGHWVSQQEAAGRPVHPLVSMLGRGSQFFYSFATGRVILPSGRAVPWRRYAASRLRGHRWAKPIRKALLAPDVAMRQVRLAWVQAQGSRGASTTGAAGAAGRLGRLASRIGLGGLGISGGAGAGAAGTGAAGAGAAGAGAAGAAGAGAAEAGAAGAAGAAGVSVASVIGVVAGVVVAIVALVAVVVAATIALGKFVGSVRESASAALEAKRQYAITTPAIAAVLSQKEVIDLAENARRGRMLASTAQAELASYQRFQEGTRNIEILGSVLGSHIKIAMQDALRILLSPLEKLAELINRWIGIEEEKQGITSPREHPLLRAFLSMAKDEMAITMGQDFYRWPRQKPPKPINMGPEEK